MTASISIAPLSKKDSIIGFTGSRAGLTDHQKIQIFLYLTQEKNNIKFVVHGDCIGSDADFHEIATEMGLKVRLRPCNLSSQRAYCKSDDILPAKGPIDRNHDIVDESDMMLSAPAEDKEVLRSGTWATIRYAALFKRPMIIIYPTGLEERRHEKEQDEA